MVSGLDLGLAALNVGLAYVLYKVGRVVLARRPHGGGELAGIAFALWWFTLAALQFAGILDFVIRATGTEWSLAAYLTYVQLIILVIMAALGALLYYMVFVFTGKRRAWIPIAVGYGLLYVLLLYYIALGEPTGVARTEVGTELTYKFDLSETALAQGIGIAFLLPTILAAIGYLSLYTKVDEPSQKFRIVSVGLAFLLWFGSSLLVGQLTDWGDTTAWRVASAFITLASALAVYMGFRPPAWLRRRFHLSGYGEHP